MINKNLLYNVSLMIFIDSIGFSLILPILPELFLNAEIGFLFNNIPLTREALYSLSLALFPLSAIFGMPILGFVSDKLGRDKIIVYGLIALSFNYLIFIISILMRNIWLFLLARIMTGFLSGTYAIGDAMISEFSRNDEERISNFKLPTVASITGFIIGPGLSAYDYKLTITNPLIFPFAIAFILSVINALLFLNSFKNLNFQSLHITDSHINKDGDIERTKVKIKDLFASLVYIFANQRIRLLAISFFLFEFGCSLYLESLSLYLTLNFNYNPTNIGEFFVIMGIIMVASMYSLHKLISKHINYVIQLKVGLSITSVILLITSMLYRTKLYEEYCGHVYIVWLTTIIFYILFPFTTLGFTNLFANSIDHNEQGKIMGGSGQVYSLAWFISGLMIGTLVSNYYFILIIPALSFLLSFILLKSYIKWKTT